MTMRLEMCPIGNYSDYSSGPYTSWYMKIDSRVYIFDSPISNVGFIVSEKGRELLKDVENVIIFITSLKETRIGGLKTMIDVFTTMGLTFNVFFPLPLVISASNYLELVGARIDKCNVMRGEYYQDSKIQAFTRAVDHDGIVKSFAYMIYGGDMFINRDGTNWSSYYSPDNRIFMDEVVLESFLAEPKEKTIYHCISMNLDDETHCYRDRITKTIPKELRSHIYPLNVADAKEARRYKTQGFATV